MGVWALELAGSTQNSKVSQFSHLFGKRYTEAKVQLGGEISFCLFLSHLAVLKLIIEFTLSGRAVE